jgi:two-component system NtrC family sensor kinase
MPEGGTLELRATRDSLERGGSSTAAVRIELEDTGVGMDADTLSRLFEPFFTTKEQGSGLGLSISYGLIQAHNGEISARSQVGEGTTFSLLLPIDQD